MLKVWNHYSGLDPPISITNQENALTDLSMAQSGGDIFSAELPSFQMTLTLCQADKNLTKLTERLLWKTAGKTIPNNL